MIGIVEGMRMSRSGYFDCDDNWSLIKWRGAVLSALRGRQGQRFLREMLAAFEALHEKKLIKNELEKDGQYCAIGVVGRARGLDMSTLDPDDSHTIAATFGIAAALARELVFENDECGYYDESDETRFKRMKRWIESNLQ